MLKRPGCRLAQALSVLVICGGARVILGMSLGGGGSGGEEPSYLFTPAATVDTGVAPGRIAVSPEGGFAVVLSQKKEIALYDAYGTFQHALGVGGRPSSIAIRANGELLLGDRHFGEVARYDWWGQKIGFLGFGRGEVLDPIDIDIDREAGRIYVLDAGHHHIRVFNWDGEPLTTIGSWGAGDGQLDHPVSLAVQPSTGDVYVADFKNQRIQVFERTGAFLWAFGTPGSGEGEIFRPGGVAIDGHGRVLVSDMFHGWVQAFDQDGEYLGLCAGWGKEDGKLLGPADLAVDEQNRLLVAATGSREVEIFDSLAGGTNPLPPELLPAVRDAVVTLGITPFLPNPRDTLAEFRIELWGASVHQVDMRSVRLNGALEAVRLRHALGERPGVFFASFRKAHLNELLRSARGRALDIEITGELAGDGSFAGHTALRRGPN